MSPPGPRARLGEVRRVARFSALNLAEPRQTLASFFSSRAQGLEWRAR
ncbi:MAG: hypothetical protein O9320_08765 [Magnetospirillum sp.]|nr:hypothetical protein [Magnetospirillum sp.]